MATSTWKAFPFFSLLRKGSSFKWMTECEEAFQKFKEYLFSTLTLHKPKSGTPLYLYLSISEVGIANALILED